MARERDAWRLIVLGLCCFSWLCSRATAGITLGSSLGQHRYHAGLRPVTTPGC